MKPDRVDRRFLRLFPGYPFLSAQRLKLLEVKSLTHVVCYKSDTADDTTKLSIFLYRHRSISAESH